MTDEYTTEYVTSLHGQPVWEAIWKTIKGWDISRDGSGEGALYHGPTGDDATRIYEAVMRAKVGAG